MSSTRGHQPQTQCDGRRPPLPLPKVHQNPSDPPYRPIVDYTGSCTYNFAKELSRIINPIIGQTSHHLNNPKDLKDKIEDITLDDDHIWISHDVVALFPSVPVPEALQVIQHNLEKDKSLYKRTKLSPSDIMDLLKLVVDHYIHLQGPALQTELRVPHGQWDKPWGL